MFSLESPHQGDVSEYTHNTIFNIKITLTYPGTATKGFCFQGTQEFVRTVVVNDPAEFESLKFYCTSNVKRTLVNMISLSLLYLIRRL